MSLLKAATGRTISLDKTTLLQDRSCSLVLRFLARHSPESLPATFDETPPPFNLEGRTNPFLPQPPNKSYSKRMHAPRYSIRRQKILFRELEQIGWPTNVLPPPFAKPSAPVPVEQEQKKERMRAQPLAGNSFARGTELLNVLEIPRKGPHLGRPNRILFKGKKWEREYEEKKAKIDANLAVADDRIQAHKEKQRLAKQKAKPLLPW